MKFIPASNYGIKDDTINVLSENNNRVIGYLPNSDAIQPFKNGDTSQFRPVQDWQLTFSPSLSQQLNLPWE